ncbi:MAG: zinc finger domain-containing protein, partial [Bdellovibrionales bacterium]
AVRRVVTGAMERERNEKKIGSSLQAHPRVFLKEEQKSFLEGLEFDEICISSSITLMDKPLPASAFTLAEVSDVGVVVETAQGKKCERCWKVLPEVGKHADPLRSRDSAASHPDLCNRCHDAVVHMRKEAA